MLKLTAQIITTNPRIMFAVLIHCEYGLNMKDVVNQLHDNGVETLWYGRNELYIKHDDLPLLCMMFNVEIVDE